MDIIKVNILEDGTIRSETDPISGPNHQSAEEFLKTVHHLTGGAGRRIKKESTHSHNHQHNHLDHQH